jgi:hypothetical protein
MSKDTSRMKKLLGLSTTLPQAGGGMFSGLFSPNQQGHSHGHGCGCGHGHDDEDDLDEHK